MKYFKNGVCFAIQLIYRSYVFQYLKTVQGHLHLCELSHTMSQLCKLMRLHRTFKIHASCADAVQSFEGLQS